MKVWDFGGSGFTRALPVPLTVNWAFVADRILSLQERERVRGSGLRI